MPPIAMVAQPKATRHITLAGWQTMMPGNTVVVQQMTALHIMMVAQPKDDLVVALPPLGLPSCPFVVSPSHCTS
jgi:hypothetical protein